MESQASCFTRFCSNSSRNKQTTEVVSKEPNMLRKTHACSVCLWLTDEMFNISIRSWFPLWLPPSRLMFRSDSFFIIFFILCPTLPLFFSSLKYTFSSFYLYHHVYMWIFGCSVLFLMLCFWYPFTSVAVLFGSMGFGMPGTRVFILIHRDILLWRAIGYMLGFK